MSEPRHKALLIASGISGFAIAAALIAALAALDPDRLGHVLINVGGFPAILMLWFFVGASFALAHLATFSLRLSGNRSSGTRISWSISLQRPHPRRFFARPAAAVAAQRARNVRRGARSAVSQHGG